MPTLAVFSRSKSKKPEPKGKQPESQAPAEKIERTTNGTPILKKQYVHVPTHAAADAMSTAPPSLRGYHDSRATSRASSARSVMGSRSSSYDSQYSANAARGRYMSYYRDNSYSNGSFRSVPSNLSNIDSVIASHPAGKSDDASLTPTSSTSSSSVSSHLNMQANQHHQQQKQTSHNRYSYNPYHSQQAPSCRSVSQRPNLHMLPKSERTSSSGSSIPRVAAPRPQPVAPKPVVVAPPVKARSSWFRFGKSQSLTVSATA